MSGEAGRPAPDRPVIGIGLALLAAAGVVLWQSWGLRASFGNQAVGPQMAPFMVSGLLAVLGLLTVREGARGEAPAREAADWRPVAWIAGGLAAMIALMTSAGFVPAVAVLFAATARGFGSARPLADIAIGLVMGLAAYLFFARVLGLSLPSGFVETLL